MKRRRSLRVVQRDDHLLPRIQTLTAEQPFGGYRRIWAYLHVAEQLPVTKQRILRVMREDYLLVQPNLQLTAKRTPGNSKPWPTTPHE